ncbi:hypothetical protein V3C99_014489 [Haemonchus contortus]
MALKSLLALFLVGFANSLLTNQELACDDGWLRLFSSCYYFEENRMTFAKAEANCLAKGGKLFVPETAIEWKEVVKRAGVDYWSWVGMKRDGLYMPRWRGNGGVNVAELDWLVNPGSLAANGWTSATQCLAHYNSGFSQYSFFYYCEMAYNSICKKRAAIPSGGIPELLIDTDDLLTK